MNLFRFGIKPLNEKARLSVKLKSLFKLTPLQLEEEAMNDIHNSRAFLYRSSDFTIPAYTQILFPFNASKFDNLLEFNAATGQFKVKEKGFYLISVAVSLSAPLEEGRDRIMLDVMGHNYYIGTSLTLDANSSGDTISATGLLELIPSESLEIYLTNDFGFDFGIVPGANQTYLSIFRVA